jgi:hypothetical protein
MVPVNRSASAAKALAEMTVRKHETIKLDRAKLDGFPYNGDSQWFRLRGQYSRHGARYALGMARSVTAAGLSF